MSRVARKNRASKAPRAGAAVDTVGGEIAAPGATEGALAAMEERIWTEEIVARVLGLPVILVREVRTAQLLEGEHFVTQRSGSIVYTGAGVAKLREELEGRLATADEVAAARTALVRVLAQRPAPRAQPEHLRVVRVLTGKRALCRRANGLEVVVGVRESANLVPGLELKGCRPGEFIWFYYGRLPRRKGRW